MAGIWIDFGLGAAGGEFGRQGPVQPLSRNGYKITHFSDCFLIKEYNVYCIPS